MQKDSRVVKEPIVAFAIVQHDDGNDEHGRRWSAIRVEPLLVDGPDVPFLTDGDVLTVIPAPAGWFKLFDAHGGKCMGIQHPDDRP